MSEPKLTYQIRRRNNQGKHVYELWQARRVAALWSNRIVWEKLCVSNVEADVKREMLRLAPSFYDKIDDYDQNGQGIVNAW